MTRTEPMTDRSREERAPRILARTFYRELLAQGFDARQIAAFADEVAALARDDAERPRHHA